MYIQGMKREFIAAIRDLAYRRLRILRSQLFDRTEKVRDLDLFFSFWNRELDLSITTINIQP
jgi:hypothetical protein